MMFRDQKYQLERLKIGEKKEINPPRPTKKIHISPTVRPLSVFNKKYLGRIG